MLMTQEETTPPGYCMLQQICLDKPTALTEIWDQNQVRYRGNKVLLKNTFINRVFKNINLSKNGPAGTLTKEGCFDQDHVFAFPMKTLPEFLSTWLQQQTQQGKLSQDMKRYIESTHCYVVPVGRNDSPFKEAEWRVSTSHAERCLMFNLNITQLQCYVMLKLLLQTHLKHPQGKTLSSFLCKNILLICIGKTHSSEWHPQNLLYVFTFVLLQLKRCISQKQCPHFILHENNLMTQNFTPEVKNWLLEKIQFIYETHSRAFLDIDDIGNRLRTKLNTPSHSITVRDISHEKAGKISGALFYNLASNVGSYHSFLLQSIISGKISFNCIITILVQLNHHGSYLEQAAARLLTPLFCSSLGSSIASRDICNDHSVSPKALTWLSLGLNSDVASSRLKLASLYYCIGDFHATETILSETAGMYDHGLVEAVCGCGSYVRERFSHSENFDDYSNTHNELSIRHSVAYCVRFIPEEVNCQPPELQYEMFRSTQEERLQREIKGRDFWMDCAVVDSLPFLYFLQYKTYGHLQRYDKQLQALNNLVISTHKTRNLQHKETALNLIGQCYKKENRHIEALHCYLKSLHIRPTNNTAKLHICLLIFDIYTNSQSMQ